MELGISTFVETTPDVNTGETLSHAQRLREVVEEIVLADQVGLDVYGVGEHHRPDFAASSPAVLMVAAAPLTNRIRLTSAVMILSSADPVRVFQDFATLDGISNGRAEIMVGRGSFVESFPLFGYDLKDYEALFDEKLDLLLKLRESEKVSWSGKHRPAIHNLGIYPRPEQNPLPVWIASAGSPESAVRAGTLGLPFALAIIGNVNPSDYATHVRLYKEAAAKAGHDVSQLPIASHSHGFIAKSNELALEKFFPSTHARTNVRAVEKGCRLITVRIMMRRAALTERYMSAVRRRLPAKSSTYTSTWGLRGSCCMCHTAPCRMRRLWRRSASSELKWRQLCGRKPPV